MNQSASGSYVLPNLIKVFFFSLIKIILLLFGFCAKGAGILLVKIGDLIIINIKIQRS